MRKQLTAYLDLKLRTIERELVLASLREQESLVHAAERALERAKAQAEQMSLKVAHTILRGRNYTGLPSGFGAQVRAEGRALCLAVGPVQEQVPPVQESGSVRDVMPEAIQVRPLAPEPAVPVPSAANPPSLSDEVLPDLPAADASVCGAVAPAMAVAGKV